MLEEPQKEEKIKKFEYKAEITFCYLNPEGTLNHYEYARFFGIARELFGLKYIPNFKNEIGKNYLLQTLSACYKYHRPLFFGDTILVKIWVSEVGNTHFALKAEFLNDKTKDLCATGEQKIVYTDIKGRPQPMPIEMKKLLKSAQY